jgi:hypothetical protein
MRDKGVYEPPSRVPESARAAERRAEEAAASARVHAAREEIASEEAAASERGAAPKRRDRTVLVLLALTGLAGLIYWLTQRTPAKNETKIEVGAPSVASASKP